MKGGPTLTIPPLPPGGGLPLGEVILKRGSTRFFSHDPISLGHLGSILRGSLGPLAADFLGEGESLVEVYIIVNAVEGLPSGSYRVSPVLDTLEPLREGKYRAEAGYLCLEQDLGADAAAVVFFLSDLESALARFGNRAYRAAQLEAGIRGGRMYLAAYSLGLGATGLTFYDDDVVDFFSPRAAGQEAIFVVALGRAARGRASRVERLKVVGRPLQPFEAVHHVQRDPTPKQG